MFCSDYKKKLEKLNKKKTIERDLFNNLLNEHKKDDSISEKAEEKINKIVDSYNALLENLDKDLKANENITKEMFDDYKNKFKEITK